MVKSGALSLLSVTLMLAVQVSVSPRPSRSAASMISLYSGWVWHRKWGFSRRNDSENVEKRRMLLYSYLSVQPERLHADHSTHWVYGKQVPTGYIRRLTYYPVPYYGIACLRIIFIYRCDLYNGVTCWGKTTSAATITWVQVLLICVSPISALSLTPP